MMKLSMVLLLLSARLILTAALSVRLTKPSCFQRHGVQNSLSTAGLYTNGLPSLFSKKSKNGARGLSLTAKKKDEDFPDPHALMEYLDGSSSESSINGDGSEFISFEDYQELQRKEVYLRACPLFRSCSDADFSRIAKAMVQVDVAPGEKLFSQGESGDLASAMYFLKTGSVEAIGELESNESDEDSNVETQKVIYKTYSKEGDFFGELALLCGQPRAASVLGSGSKPSQVYQLDKNAFLESIEDSPVFDTAKRLILAKYRSNRLWDVIPKIRLDEFVGLAKAKLVSSKNRKRIDKWFTTFRTYTLGACAMYLMTNSVKVVALKPLLFLTLGAIAHLL